ncbi:tetratricopeptide repeat protein [Solimonas terrae]|uniref:Tetratricopeptide repeat protein n=1 Tax=Solimonas terrae TaxID=1396819 RepID=A0A6M2BNV7_9GAMM|nr:tetratricopeptide repeat protein [Solimonas terrae]NGY03713.1 tetratricopeptide repeat protein [Solimonas terrae]
MKARLALALVTALLPLAASAVETYEPGSADDPQVRLARFLDDDKRHFSAIVELQQIAGKTDPLKMPAEYQWRLADNYLGFGMRDRAEEIYRNLATIAPDPKRIGQANLQLAEFDYERGYTAEARATLYRMREKLPPELMPDWQDLLGRVLMAEGRYGEAADALLKDGDKQSAFTRYNLGIALLNDGRTVQGQTVLDNVGTMRPQTSEELALRDRANLTLGWQFLQTQQGGTAKPVFSRVRVEGPFSNRALLGLGWAQLAPQGSRIQKADTPDADSNNPKNRVLTTLSTLGVLIRPGYLDQDVFDRAGLHSFRLRNSDPETEAALRRALVPWIELTKRDPMDPAVEEAWLAIPYTLDKLDAHTQALQYYEKAVDILENARSRMNEAMASIKQGRMVETIVRRDLDSEAGWDWKLHDLPDAPETYFLQNLLAEHRFQEALKNYRDLRMLSRNIEAWRVRLDGIAHDYSTTERPAGDADVLIKRALSDATPPYPDVKATLRFDSHLAAPGAYNDKLSTGNPPLPALALAAAPARFDGPYERTLALQARVGNLREQLTAAGADQAQLLQDMSMHELEGQRQQIERYLIEARFALARLYDRQKQGDQ